MLTVVDLFSGIGGFSLGLEATGGFRTIQFCEIDPYARRVLAHHWPEVPCHDDIRTMAGVPADVLCGGFPCQDISLSGTGAGLDGARSGLWFEYLRLIDEGKPAWVIIENVPALRGRGLDVVLRGLASIGYDAEWHCIPAAAIGALHRRDRIWIVANDPHAVSARRPRQKGAGEAVSGAKPGQPGGLDSGNAALADTDSPRLEIIIDRNAGELPSAIRAHAWTAEPDVGRVAYGISSRVDRLKCLGNSVVPQIAELIGRAILKANACQPPACPRAAPDR